MRQRGQYRLAAGRPDPALLGPETSEAVKAAVLEAYTEVQNGRRLGDLRAAIFALARECPYCGFAQLEDLDHHLVKAVFKLFSIFSWNLIPACAMCNRKKPRRPSADLRTNIVHPYLETVPAHALLATARLAGESNALIVKYDAAAEDALGADWRERLRHHLRVFGLHDRWSAQVNIYLAALETSFDEAFAAGGAEKLRDYLAKSAERTAVRFGSNDWRAVLLVALSDCEPFCNGGYRSALGF